ncbi:MAG: FHA domain-containing protein [Pirellulaceae bacterium]
MFQSWRFQLKKAEEAFKCGRLDDAQRLLCDGELMQYLPAQKLSAKVAEAMAQRAARRIAEGDTQAGWNDVRSAQRLGGETQQLASARAALIARGLAEVDNYLRTGDAGGALLRIESLEGKGLASDRLRALREVCRRLERGRGLERVGKFADAEMHFAAAATLRPDLPEIDERRERAGELAVKARELNESLHRAQAEGDWSRVLSIACELLEHAPECAVARDARKRAWEEVGAGAATSNSQTDHTYHWRPTRGGATATAEPAAKPKSRFLLWIDAIGGFLVCQDDQIVLGQASPGNDVDVPILGDVARRHAKIRRQGEEYVLDPLGMVLVDGRLVNGPVVLGDGEEIQLGESVRLRFRKPHALSASARLDFVSRHRSQPSADAVLLMAESCVLGPKWQNHVVCRDWPDDVVLYRQDGELYCRSMESIEVDGRVCDGRGRLTRNSHVASDTFSLSLEEIPA